MSTNTARPGARAALAAEYTEILKKPTCSVSEAAKLCGIGRDGAYAAVKRGEIPTIQIGERLRVPTARLRAMLGLNDEAA